MSEEHEKQPVDGEKETGAGDEAGSDQHEGHSRGPTMAQWVVGSTSTVLVLAMLAFLVYEAVSGAGRPPLISLGVERVIEVPGGFEVEVVARNDGDATARDLNVEGTLKRDTVTIETSVATILYLPGESTRRAGLFFTEDPRAHALEVRPVGYDRP